MLRVSPFCILQPMAIGTYGTCTTFRTFVIYFRYIIIVVIALSLAPGLGAQEPDRGIYNIDSLARKNFVSDSALAREAFVRDSILAREAFIRDSILAREQFVRDSLLRRKRILDSLHIIKPQLERLLLAYYHSVREDIINKCLEIPVIGDSILGDFIVCTLPFGVKDPYCPWKIRLNLSGNPLRITRDERTNRIASIHTSVFKASFTENTERKLLIIHHPAVVQRNSRGNFYKIPVDSVFYDKAGRIGKIKSYVIFHNLTNDNQKGQLLFTNTTQVKQYAYNEDGDLLSMQLVRFCERWRSFDPNKVCSIINYSFSRDKNKVSIARKNDPVNIYSDGVYTFQLTDGNDITSISFMNSSKTEEWERTIEMNKEGNVSCYFDKSKGLIFQSLCMIYHPESGARYPVETITTTFEKDGISYLQKNNTTGKVRSRNRMTLEWSPWR